MPQVYADRVKESSTTTGTGTLTLAGAVTNFQSFAAIGNGNTVLYTIEHQSAAEWEVGLGTYTSAGTTLSRSTVLASSNAGAAVSFSAGTKHVWADFPALRAAQAGFEQITGTDADTTMVVNAMYVVDMSAWATADRTYTLPATAAVGDRVGIMVTTGDASHELKITAASGDTLNGISGGTEWSRLFITGEVVIMRCVVANATWVIENDGRIPARCSLQLTTNASGEGAATYVYPTSNSGVWTADHEIGFTDSATLGKFIARRAGKYNFYGCGRPTTAPADGKYFQIKFELDGTTSIFEPAVVAGAATAGANFAQGSLSGYTMAVDGYMRYMYRSEEGSKGLRGASALSQFTIQEQLR